MRSVNLVMAGLLALAAAACEMGAPRSGTSSQPETTTTTTTKQAELAVTYISGHLGNYWDCPSDAVPLSSAAGKADQAGPAEPGACRDDADCPPVTLNCEDAVLTVRLENVGDADATGLLVSDLELLGLETDDILAVLEPLSVETTGGVVWDDVLSPGETVDIRIVFKGPKTSDLGWDGGGRIHLIMTGTNNLTGTLVTPELQVLPTVAT